ncbi:PREDICTED: RNA-binding protein NOB1-like isoform X1 [Amphimedon queenslandica]|uniref:Nin one binding (NOB1) Zn-ribbon-like domain-containing protein n=1 Tax=Amphimedon queenslandica TaxID=400682 RepID=A0AAN0JMT8_AMPQE|nr:PREDICTED: RNA-binding protein NOB1-like isoform X1 [Amphimedon queenslandica]|eukprot:XP_019858314.1 PREDICTED: RNA-binding protein NOB1-like isoform X1 [Amphimedon queenslandica]
MLCRMSYYRIGLNVVSIDGMLIKRIRTYAQQCKACFKVYFKSGLLFCPNCGNKSMIKVLADVGKDGLIHYSSLSDKQFSDKGLRYSLPLPKGGRRPDQLLLSLAQRLTFCLPRSRNKPHPLDPDYISQSFPFSFNDVTSRGAQIAFRAGGGRGRVGGAWHRNPNQVRKKK